MGILHVQYMPGGPGEPFKELEYKYGETKEMPNDHLLWQIRLCSIPGKVDVIAAFDNKDDAITYMTMISEHNGHKIVLENRITSTGIRKENEEEQKKHGCESYSIEHNSSTKDERLI